MTDQWIISFGTNASESVEEFDLDEDEPLKARRHERGFDWFVAKSLGPHWSVGFLGGDRGLVVRQPEVQPRDRPGDRVQHLSVPGLRVAALRRDVRRRRHPFAYNEVTLFGKLEETLPVQELSVELEQEQPWGSLQIGSQWSQYLHDRTKYRLEVDGELSFRVARGLELNADASVSRIRDQLSIPRRDATSEEVLLRLRELLSGYEVSFSIGVTYSFGSIFNNVVNPRFGR